MLTESLLIEELRQWSKSVLEKPNKDFNNLPACPFAEHTWDTGKVKVMLGEGGLWSDLIEIIKNFDDKYEVVIYCGIDYDTMTEEEFKKRLKLLSVETVKNNLWIMGSHPDSKTLEHAAEQIDFAPLSSQDYYQIFLQKLDTLVKASDSIIKKNYYKNYSKEDFNEFVELRRKRWLEEITAK